jgi:uncharacterized membrane protein
MNLKHQLQDTHKNITPIKLKTLFLLLVWLFIGTGLRLSHLTGKPPWTDEFSTLVFSLGNSFRVVPLDRAIALDVLLQPLQPNPDRGVTQVVGYLLTESNHPPLYFVLTHWWMQLWSPDSFGLVSVWAARSLSALFGAASIPAIYGIGWLAFRSQLVSHLAAAMMAVSPYGIFLAQEARHYTLAILWVIASLSCLVIATRHIQHRTQIPIWLVATWVVINILGISTHYFFSLTLCAEALVLLALRWHERRGTDQSQSHSPWWQIYIVAVATVMGGLVWLPVFLQNSYGSKLTEWIQNGDRSGLAWLNPIFQAVAAWVTMLCLLPVEASALPVVLVSGGVMIIFLLWALPILRSGITTQLKQPETRLMIQVFAGVVCSAIALFFVFTYAFGIDLTRGARYNFVYFPAAIVLLGASLAVCWNSPIKQGAAGKTAVMLIWLMGLLSGLTVVCNLGYQKYYRPDLLVQLIQNKSQSPVLIATTHKTHVQIGEMMGIAREFKLSGSPATPLFLLAHQDQDPNTSTTALQQTLNQLPRPLDLWLVNFYAPVKIDSCVAEPQSLPPVDGYNYQLYHCQ